MVRALMSDGTFTSNLRILFGAKPLFYTLRYRVPRQRIPHPPKIRPPRPVLPTLEIACIVNDVTRAILYRQAVLDDLKPICAFVDFWLSGKAKSLKIPGAGSDFFVPVERQKGYLNRYATYIATFENNIVGWGVKSTNESLIHLLVCPEYRGKGVGTNILRILQPAIIRSKSDQSTGNPLKFYLKHGYTIETMAQGKHKNIDILRKVENPPKNEGIPTSMLRGE